MTLRGQLAYFHKESSFDRDAREGAAKDAEDRAQEARWAEEEAYFAQARGEQRAPDLDDRERE